MSAAAPGPVRWLWYAFDGKLPQRYREWVLGDVTARTWLLRFTVRSVVRLVPLVLGAVLALVLVLYAPLGLALASAAIGFIVGIYFSMSYAGEKSENQIARYGYPRGTAEATRKQRAIDRDPGQQERYDASWRTPPPT